MSCTLGRVFENYMRLKIKCITHKLFLRKAASRKRFLNVSRFAEATTLAKITVDSVRALKFERVFF